MVLNPLRVVSASRLARVRLVLHHAAWLLLPPDASPASLRWALDERVLWGPEVRGRQVGLRLAQVQLLTRDIASGATAWFRLGHQTMAAATSWLASGGSPRPSQLRHHAVLSGGRFPAPSQASLQLENEFHGAAKMLLELGVSGTERITVSADTLAVTVVTTSRGRTLTLGFSPGAEAAEPPFWFAQRDSDAEALVGAQDVGPLDPARAPFAVEAVRRFLRDAIDRGPVEGGGRV